MEIDSDIFIIDEYLNSHLSLPLQKIILSYIDNMILEYMKNGEINLLDWILRKLYEIKYLNKYNNLRNEFDSDCINDNKQIIICFRQNKQYDQFNNLLNHNNIVHKTGKYTDYGKSIVFNLNKNNNFKIVGAHHYLTNDTNS